MDIIPTLYIGGFILRIEFITGVMGAGKSKELIDNYYTSLHNKKNPLILTLSFTENNLAQTTVKSRNGESVPAIAVSIEKQGLLDFDFIEKDIEKKYDCVYIDESQFLNIETIQQLVDICDKKDMDIFFYGLSKTFTGSYFDASEFLLNVLDNDSIKTIQSICEEIDCFKFAEWNARLIDGCVVITGDVLMEEKSTYKSLCSLHFLPNMDKQKR